jgi:hypothetical protein
MSYPDANPNEVRKQIKSIKAWMQTEDGLKYKETGYANFKNEASKVFSKFAEDYPTVLDLVLKEDDLGILNQMLDMIEKINTRKIDKLDGEKIIGERLADEYLYPVVNENMKRKN